jgi:hypothetical protein
MKLEFGGARTRELYDWVAKAIDPTTSRGAENADDLAKRLAGCAVPALGGSAR